MKTLNRLLISLWLLIAFIGGAWLDDAITPPVKQRVYVDRVHTISKPVPVYQPIKPNARFNAQLNLIAAAIPASALTYRRK